MNTQNGGSERLWKWIDGIDLHTPEIYEIIWPISMRSRGSGR